MTSDSYIELGARVSVDSYPGIAWTVRNYVPIFNEYGDDEGYTTDKLVCVMVGDDRPFTFGIDELSPLADDAYCASCGQVGCGHDVRA